MSEQQTQIEPIGEFTGKTFTAIDRNPDTGDVLIFTTSDGERYKMWHHQNCCETVELVEVIGNLADLIGEPLTMAEVVTDYADTNYGDEQWTFYKLATAKGYVTLRWYGASNGYYSVSVDIDKY